MLTEKAAMYSTLGISKEVFAFGTKIEEELKERFAKIDEIAEYNQLKVIHAMQASKVSEACLYGTTGYGYNDLGRDTLEQVYATCFGTEDALVRPQIACGTHALATALSGNLRPGDELLSPVGKPYDTLEEVIGIRPSVGSLAEYGVTYRQVDLKEDGSFDYEGIKNAINKKTKMVTIQRSKGYQTRPTLSVTRIGELLRRVRGDDRTDQCRCRSDGRIPDQKPGRRTGSGRRLHCWKEKVRGKCSIPSALSGTWKRGWRNTRCERFLLPGILPGTDRYRSGIKRCCLCCKCL